MLVLLRAVLLGAPVLVHETFEPERLAAEAASADRTLFVSVVPTMVHRLVSSGAALPGVTLLVGGGEEAKAPARALWGDHAVALLPGAEHAWRDARAATELSDSQRCLRHAVSIPIQELYKSSTSPRQTAMLRKYLHNISTD